MSRDRPFPAFPLNRMMRLMLVHISNRGVIVLSWKSLNRIILVFLVILGLGYIINLNHTAARYASSNTIGPTYFPNVLTAILIILCIIAFIQGKDTKESKVVLPNYKHMLFTLAMTVLFILTWQFIGFFYVAVFLFGTILLTVYRIEKGLKRSLIVGAFTSLVTTVVIYVLFGIVLAISL